MSTRALLLHTPLWALIHSPAICTSTQWLNPSEQKATSSIFMRQMHHCRHKSRTNRMQATLEGRFVVLIKSCARVPDPKRSANPLRWEFRMNMADDIRASTYPAAYPATSRSMSRRSSDAPIAHHTSGDTIGIVRIDSEAKTSVQAEQVLLCYSWSFYGPLVGSTIAFGIRPCP